MDEAGLLGAFNALRVRDTREEAQRYLQQIRVEFPQAPDMYVENFRKIWRLRCASQAAGATPAQNIKPKLYLTICPSQSLQEYLAHMINMTAVTDRICALFRGHNSLILAINPFLVEQFKIQPNDCRLASSSANSNSTTAQRMAL
eukprot:2424-Heterococcus_DN1.PRE.1